MMNLASFLRTLPVCLVLLQTPPPVRGQITDPASTLRLAQALEQAGDYERAIPLYRELYLSNPSNIVFFDGLQRVFLQLKHYDDAIALIREQLQIMPGNVSLLCQLGSVFYKAGQEKEAMAEWDRALASQPVNAGVYRTVASTMIENRLLDKAADVYRRARVALSDPDLFCMELGQLLSVSMDYDGASREYLRWLRRNPTQLPFVEGRMGLFTGKEDGRKAATAAVRAAMEEYNDISLKQLLAWLQLEGKDFAAAFDTYKSIDRDTHAEGSSIYQFADRAFKEHAYGIAARAYREAINTPLPKPKLPYAEYGEACALKELGSASDTIGGPLGRPATVNEAPPDYRGAIRAFEKVIASYPHSEFSARSYYQIGLIQLQKYFDLDAALRAFQQVGQEVAGIGVLRYDVALRIASVYTAKGDTSQAAGELKSVLNTSGALPDQSDEATYRLAELDYFGGNFEGAVRRLEGITLNLKADYANDALLLLAFLHENFPSATGALTQFAYADFLARQRKNTEAISRFQEIVKDFPKALLVDDALMKIGELQSDAGLYSGAVATYNRLLRDFKESSVGLDRAQFRVAEIQQFGLQDRAKAIEAYEQFLAQYPSSILADQARKRIRQLRGDAL